MRKTIPTRNFIIWKADWQVENDMAEERTLTLSQQRGLSESNTIYAVTPTETLKWQHSVPEEAGVKMVLK